MLKNEPSFASLLVKQSPGMHFGHGWIAGQDGKRWHPSRSQSDLLADLSTKKQRKSWLSKLFPRMFR
ncbi:TPA: phage filamentation protein Fil family protein [Enterobacter cloacae]